MLIFLLVFKLLDLTLSYTVACLDNWNPLDYGSIRHLYAGAINADACFFGTSRTMLQIRPEKIRETTGLSAWNLGMDGSNLDQNVFTFEEYLLHNKKPRIVAFDVDADNLDPKYRRFQKKYFSRFQRYSRHTWDLFNQTWQDYLKNALILSAGNEQILGIIRAFIFPQKTPADVILERGAYLRNCTVFHAFPQDDNNISSPPPGQASPSLAENPKNHKEKVYDIEINEELKTCYRELAKNNSQNGLITVFFFPPRYNDGRQNDLSHEQALDFFSGLERQYPEIYTLDFSADQDFNKKELFWTPSHLNFQGANLLSEKIGKTINQILSKNPNKHQDSR